MAKGRDRLRVVWNTVLNLRSHKGVGSACLAQRNQVFKKELVASGESLSCCSQLKG